mmetsp:Transcript_6429/g.13205  ORF Transcript_6429/g.13205 Transcript_6429/m.13205 type:complete len:408 (-) Transcript_6429:347-1570(-)
MSTLDVIGIGSDILLEMRELSNALVDEFGLYPRSRRRSPSAEFSNGSETNFVPQSGSEHVFIRDYTLGQVIGGEIGRRGENVFGGEAEGVTLERVHGTVEVHEGADVGGPRSGRDEDFGVLGYVDRSFVGFQLRHSLEIGISLGRTDGDAFDARIVEEGDVQFGIGSTSFREFLGESSGAGRACLVFVFARGGLQFLMEDAGFFGGDVFAFEDFARFEVLSSGGISCCWLFFGRRVILFFHHWIVRKRQTSIGVVSTRHSHGILVIFHHLHHIFYGVIGKFQHFHLQSRLLLAGEETRFGEGRGPAEEEWVCDGREPIDVEESVWFLRAAEDVAREGCEALCDGDPRSAVDYGVGSLHSSGGTSAALLSSPLTRLQKRHGMPLQRQFIRRRHSHDSSSDDYHVLLLL